MAADAQQPHAAVSGSADDSRAPSAPGSVDDTGAEIAKSNDDATAVTAAGQAPAPPKTTGAPSERQPTFKDFIRVFSYAKKIDWLLMVAACVSSIGSGIVWLLSLPFPLSYFVFPLPRLIFVPRLTMTLQTLPLMNVVFGKLAGTFSTATGDSAGK